VYVISNLIRGKKNEMENRIHLEEGNGTFYCDTPSPT
jgi:hypothetical protein